MNVNSGDGFDQLLNQELTRAAGNLKGPNPSAGQSAYHAAFTSGGSALSVFSTITAAVTTKAAIAATAATLVVGGAAAGTVATGSLNPANWGSAVVQAVQGCKTTIGTGSDSAKTASTARENVGQCVSAFARQHGAAERAEHASDARTNHPTVKPSDLPHGKPSDLPHGKPSDLPHGKPSDLPGGAQPTPHPTGKP